MAFSSEVVQYFFILNLFIDVFPFLIPEGVFIVEYFILKILFLMKMPAFWGLFSKLFI